MGELRLLLDTHVLLWAVLEPHKLPAGLRKVLQDPDVELLVSAASAWEIGTKWRIGKLPDAGEVVHHYGRVLDGLGARELAIGSREALQAGLWEVKHRDPFDRLLAAQAWLLDLELASTDAVFLTFAGVRVRSA